MPKRPTSPRPVDDRQVGFRDAGPILNYSPEYLRKLMRGPGAPPFHKVAGRWLAWVSELQAWADGRTRRGAA